MALEGITRHSDLWFDDGNVILIAESIGFRVYRGVLARQSEVFRDTFQIPQSTAVDATEPDCPIVHLSDDGAKEVAVMLSILFTSGHRYVTTDSHEQPYTYSPLYGAWSGPVAYGPDMYEVLKLDDSLYRYNVQVDFPTAAAALRLGAKYGFEEMKQEALRRISTCYTRDLARLHTHKGDSNDATECPVSWKGEDCIGMLHLARQLSLDELVPAALYRCANDVTLDQIFHAAANHQRLHTLTFQELQDCVCSRNDLISENIKLYDMFSELQPSAECSATKPERWEGSTCIQNTRNMVLIALKYGFFRGSLALFPMDGWIDGHTGPNQYCPSCGEHFKCTNARQRSEIWSRLASKYCGSRKPYEPDTSSSVASPDFSKLPLETLSLEHADD